MSKINTKGNTTYWIIFLVAIGVIFYLFNSAKTPKENIVSDVETKDIIAVDNDQSVKAKQDIIMITNPTAVFTTNLGEIELELFMEESPITAGNFKKLIEEGFYDGVRFHRVISNFMIQSGDPLSKDVASKPGWGTGGPGYAIEDEFIDGLSNVRGTISMANSGPNTGGSQFFINLVDNVTLDWDKQPEQSKHPVFGKVISGMDIVDKIGTAPVNGSSPIEDVIIEKIIIK